MITKKELIGAFKDIDGVSFQIVEKNNGVKKLACRIKVEEPATYAIVYFDDILKQDTTIEQFREWVSRLMVDVENVAIPKFYMAMSKAYVLENVVACLINYEKNKLFLKYIPHRIFLDLAIIPRVMFKKHSDYYSSSIMTKNWCEKEGLDPDEVLDTAIENVSVPQMYDILSIEDLMNSTREFGDTIYTGTNKVRTNGASILLFSDILGAFADKVDHDLWIAGSSIHEIMLLFDDGNPKRGDILRDVLREVNRDRQCVKEEEILSDNLYHFDRKARKLSIA